MLSSDDEDKDICDVLQVAATAIRALSTLATIENEINQFNQATSGILYHHSSLSGQLYTAELLATPRVVRIRECLHMSLEVF